VAARLHNTSKLNVPIDDVFRRHHVETVRRILQPLGGTHVKELMDMSILVRLLRDESGATAIEYGLIAAGISVAIITVVYGLGSKLSGTFVNVSSQLN
jgi:pilus assembly protein Flp/PilA